MQNYYKSFFFLKKMDISHIPTNSNQEEINKEIEKVLNSITFDEKSTPQTKPKREKLTDEQKKERKKINREKNKYLAKQKLQNQSVEAPVKTHTDNTPSEISGPTIQHINLDSFNFAPPVEIKQEEPENFINENLQSVNISVEEAENEREKLKKQYLAILITSPDLDKAKPPPAFKKIMKEIDNLDIEELRARLMFARQNVYNGIDNKIAGMLIDGVNLLVGNFLSCYDELKSEVEKDAYLNQLTANVLTADILYLVPDKLKLAGLYGMHVILAKSKTSSTVAPNN